MFKQVRVASCSFRPKKFDLATNSDRLEEVFRQAAHAGCQLAVAPEGALDGYVVMPIIAGIYPAERMYEAAISIKSKKLYRFRLLAKELHMCLAFGMAERIVSEVFNCAVFIDTDGRIRGRYHKMQLAEGYHETWWFNRLGNRSRAFTTPFGKCGMLICNDRFNPDIARIPVLDGARYLLIPAYGSRSRNQDKMVLARSRENGVPVVEANVGVTLIISKGEVIACDRRVNAMTVGVIDVPVEPSVVNRNQQETNFLRWRSKEMPIRYEQWHERGRCGLEHPAEHDSHGRLVAGE